VLAQAGKFEEAIPHMERADALANSREPEVLAFLAAMYAETGRVKEAIDAATRGLDLANSTGARDLAAKLEARIAGYKARLANMGR
jgi:tetratricopeptide (TPR) repeat protein